MNRVQFVKYGALIVFLILMVLPVSAGEVKPGEDLAALAGPPAGWTVSEPPQTVAGEQLFTVINGGAELYVRLGFTRAVFASYRSAAGRNINLEIYQMKTPESARKAYSRKVSGKGKPVEFGDEAQFEEYFLNFYRGSYQVTVSGYDSDGQTVDGIFTIAKRIDERLEKH